jgi:hypothetical protein
MEKKILTVVVSILIALLGWLGTIQFNKMAEISKDLVALRLEIVQLQKDILTKDDVKEMIETELIKHGIPIK